MSSISFKKARETHRKIKAMIEELSRLETDSISIQVSTAEAIGSLCDILRQIVKDGRRHSQR